jgi:hypothetical protein
MQLHATAIRLGRLAAMPAGNQLVSAPHRPASCRDSSKEARLLRCYRGSKTDTCLLAGGGGQRPRSGSDRQGGRRKSSVMEQLSTFLKSGLKI